MYTPTMLYEMGKIRQEEILREARQDALVKLALSGRPSRAASVLKTVRSWLGAAVERQPQQTPAQQPVACA